MPMLSASEEQNLNDWRRAHAQCELMRQWVFNTDEQADMRVELERELGVPDWLMARVHKRGLWYLHPSAIYPSLEAYVATTRAALVADVRAFQAEVAAAEAAHRKRRREALKAERAAEPPAPARAQPARASKRTRGL
jgi:hypothetical protein